MSKVAIEESVLRWAAERCGNTLQDLKKKFPKILEWAEGRTQPTLRQVEAFAKLTRTPLGFLFLAEPPEEVLPIPHFRTQDDDSPERPSPELLDTVHSMQRRQDWLREHLIRQGQKPLPFVGSIKRTRKPERIASVVREILRLKENWAQFQPTWTHALRRLRQAAEEAGIFVVGNGVVGNNTHRKLDPAEFRGFVLVDEYAPLIFINNADGKAAQMFTLAHELAHVVLGSSAAFDLREMQPADDPTEKTCNQVAAEFLVPERQLRALWSSAKIANEPFQEIARQFKVSVLVAARRALDLRLVSKKHFLQFYGLYLQDERRKALRKPAGGDFYANQDMRVGTRFARTVITAAREGELLYSEAYRLTGLYGRAFDRYADHIGLGEM